MDEIVLNNEQRQAVETLQGPILVLAGPGTGKTQLLSARVANILIKTDTDPSNIVCLTFTVNAANNMRERLRKMVGPAANQVVIKTFHSLAADIIASHPEHFYAGAVLNPISELAAQEIMHTIFDTLPYGNPLSVKFDGRYMHLTNALDAIGRAKDAGLTPEKLRIFIEAHQQELERIEPQVVELLSKPLSHKTLERLADDFSSLATDEESSIASGISRLISGAVEADLPTGKTTKTGDIKRRILSSENGQKVMAKERKANAWWRSLADVYEAYQKQLYKRGYMDYSDMLIGVIEAMEKDQDLRLDIQEATHYLLIDEFQDSNEAQIKLMHLLVDNPHIEKPNVMVVGDPNQTIYGFNGAMLDNTTDFQQFYANDLVSISLTQNYRSSQSILDDARSVITPYSSFHPELTAAAEPPSTEVTYTTYATEADQAVLIGEKIKDIFSSDRSDTIAVLSRNHKSLTYLARYLTNMGITVNYELKTDIRETTCNKLIISVLSLIQAIISGDKQGADFHLSHVLRHEAFELDPDTTWQLALQSNRTTSWLAIAKENPATRSIIDWIHSLVAVASSQSLNVLIEQLLSQEFAPRKTLYHKFYEGDPSEQALLEAQATRQLLDLAAQYAQTDHVSLPKFLDMLAGTSNKLFLFSPSTGHYEHAVTLMSVHGAKGLEFDHVFVIDTDERNWKPKSAPYPTPLSLPIHVNPDTPEDYARLMYVAMTRARSTLHVSYVCRIDTKTTALPAEQLAHFDFTTAPAVSNDQLAASETAQLIRPLPRPKTMHELLDSRLSNYALSATVLTHFLDLSRQGMETFIEEDLVRFPQPTSESLVYGNAMHAGMELAQIQTANGKRDLAAIKRLVARKLAEENLTTSALQRLTDRAHTQLDALFNGLGLTFSPTSKPEQSFSAITKSGVNMYGKIDRIDTVDDTTLCIVDYKTGRAITNPNSKAQDILLKQWRHRLQLGFYILLMKQQKMFAGKTICAQIIQLDAQSPEHLVIDYEFADSDLARTEQLALAVLRRIKSLDIPDVSGFSPDLHGIQQFEDWLLSDVK